MLGKGMPVGELEVGWQKVQLLWLSLPLRAVGDQGVSHMAGRSSGT